MNMPLNENLTQIILHRDWRVTLIETTKVYSCTLVKVILYVFLPLYFFITKAKLRYEYFPKVIDGWEINKISLIYTNRQNTIKSRYTLSIVECNCSFFVTKLKKLKKIKNYLTKVAKGERFCLSLNQNIIKTKHI